PVTQQIMQDLSERSGLVLVAGRYEGIDERLIEREIDVEYSIGDYVLSGGELPAMVLIDGITRLQPGAVGDDQSVQEDSFSAGLLDHPHYTRPEAVEGLEVPAVLLGGNHAEIKRWRQKQALGRTKLRRPDLIERRNLSADEKALLAEFEAEQAQKIKTED
ncbi:MAG: tRNA (guanine37-N1)-methyltransferase, partial [Patiriisocius sp.]